MNILGRLNFNLALTPFAGWSETYFMTSASYADAATALASIAAKRIATLSSDCELVGGLISDTDVKGDSYPTGLIFPTVGTWAVFGTDPTSNIVLAMRVKFFGGTTKRGSRWVHGIPKSQISAGGFYTPTGPFITALSAYLDQVEGSCSIGTRIKGAVAPPFYALTAYTAYTEEGVEKRNIGRPFGLYRGRRLIA